MKISTDTHSIDLPPPNHPGQIYYAPRQRGRRAQVVRSGDDRILIALSWSVLTPAQMDALERFVRNTLMYSGHTCKIEGLIGQNYSPMRYVGGMDTARVRKGDRWGISLQFEQAPLISLPFEQNLITNPNLAIGTDNTIDGWHLSNAFTTDSPDPTPPALRNIDISEDFGTRALEVVDTDPDSARLFFTERFPIADYRYTISGRLNRTVGNRACYLYVVFFDADGDEINASPSPAGWGGGRGRTYYYPGYIGQGAANDVWNLFSVTFGPGSNTSVPPTAKSFEMGTFIFGGAVNTTCRFADFSVIVTP